MPQAFILGSNAGYYVQQLLEKAPSQLPTQVIGYPELRSLLALPSTEKVEQHSTQEQCEAGTGDEGISFKPNDLLLVRSMGVGSLESIVFRMNCLAAIQQLGVKVVNPPKSLEWAIDKYASLSKMVRAGVPILPTHVAQTAEHALAGFHQIGGDVIVKPIFGGEGRGLIRVCDHDHAERVFRSLETLDSVIYQQQFLHATRDIRILFIGDQTWAIQRSSTDWRKNISRGSTAQSISPEPHWLEVAKQACQTLELQLAGVDLLIDSKGRPYVLEVNGVPGWRGIEQAHKVSIADEIWQWVTQ